MSANRYRWLTIGLALLLMVFVASRGSPEAQDATQEGHGGQQAGQSSEAPPATMEQGGHESMQQMEHPPAEPGPAGQEGGKSEHKMEAQPAGGQAGHGQGGMADEMEARRDRGWKASLINLVKRVEAYVRGLLGKGDSRPKAQHAAQKPASEGGDHSAHQSAPASPQGEGNDAMPTAAPETVMVSSTKQQIMGVTMEPVEYRHLTKVIRTVGTIDYDERKVTHVHTKISGWIEDFYVDYTGILVKKGQPLFTLYSPELVSTQEEYLLALKGKKYFADSPFTEISDSSLSLLEATRRRLLLWDITEDQIDNIERTGETKKTLTIYSPMKGYVIEKNAFEGMYINPGQDLYTIADLSTVWIYADIYEYELPFVKVGQKATVALSYYPGEVFEGKVTYIYPYLEPKTRTVRVRLEFRNKDTKLKPEMYADVELKIDAGKKLAIPEAAVLDSGTRQLVFVSLGEGHFEPREVKLGAKVGNYYEVLEGLKEKEIVVTSANFLIDSESQLQSATGGMAGMKH